MKRLPVTIWLALCIAFPATAQMYKWVDSNGKVQYSDKPPPSNIETKKLREAPPPANPPAASKTKDGAPKEATAPKTLAEQEQAFRKRKAEAAKAAEKQGQKEAEARNRAENCKRAKAALANLQLGGRQMRVDEKGERTFLTDQQIVQETARARQEADKSCN